MHLNDELKRSLVMRYQLYVQGLRNGEVFPVVTGFVWNAVTKHATKQK